MILAAAARLPPPTAAALVQKGPPRPLQESQGSASPSHGPSLPRSSTSGGSQHSRLAPAAAAAAPPQKRVPLAGPGVRTSAPSKPAAKPQSRSLAAQLAAQAAPGGGRRKPEAGKAGSGGGEAAQTRLPLSLTLKQGTGTSPCLPR